MAQQKKIRRGKKKWFPIHAPAIFENQEIGETFVYETEQIESKFVTSNLMTLTNNPKKQSFNVTFEVTSVKEGKAQTKTVGIRMQPSSVKRLARRGRSKVADSFLARSKKGQLVRVKPIVITRTRCDAQTQRAIRAKTRELLRDTLQKYSFDAVIADITQNKLQRYLKDQLSAIFPIRMAEIQFLRYAKPGAEEESDAEQTEYSARPKRERVQTPEEDSGLSSLKGELADAIEADEDDEEDDEESEDEQ